jgi:hypothetical protein
MRAAMASSIADEAATIASSSSSPNVVSSGKSVYLTR